MTGPDYIAEDLWTLAYDGSVLCPECAAEHVGYWIEHFRPNPRAAFRPHTEDPPDLDLTCDECCVSVREWVSGIYPDDDGPAGVP